MHQLNDYFLGDLQICSESSQLALNLKSGSYFTLKSKSLEYCVMYKKISHSRIVILEAEWKIFCLPSANSASSATPNFGVFLVKSCAQLLLPYKSSTSDDYYY